MRRISRRQFVVSSTVAVGATPLLLAQACAPSPPAPAATAVPQKPAAAPTSPPAAPTTAPAAPAASAPASPQVTTAPAPTAAPAATKAPAAATTAPAPAATAPAKTPRLGATLMWPTPEGSEIITDPAKWPKTFKEAPEFADLVKAGKLPPVKERIGEDPLVLKPVHEIGKYGGNLRRGFTGPGDYINGLRIALGPDMPLYLDKDLKTVIPNIARGYQMSEGDRVITLLLRRGMKWSDAAPFTADDFVFWFADVYQNKDIVPTPDARMTINGKPGKVEKVDTYTVRFVFPDPYPYFPKILALFNQVSSPAQHGDKGLGCYAPAHYMKQFLPKYVGKEELDKKVKDAGFDSWVSLFKNRNSWHINPDRPTLAPWKIVSPANKPVWTFERNPYSVWVDTEGNQLPYIDKITMALAETTELVNLRAIAGEIDMQARHIDIGKIPVLLENQAKSDYKLAVNPASWGSDVGIFFNLSYEADPELQKWINNADFRRALSLGIDRDQINEIFFVGIGVPGSAVPAESNPYNPGPEYRTLWHTFEPKKANEMLDKIGLDKKDGEGYRLRTDGKGRLSLQVTTVAAGLVQFTGICEMVAQHLKSIGISLQVQENERSLAEKRRDGNECPLYSWMSDSSDEPIVEPTYNFASDPRSSLGPLYGKWFGSGGKQGKEPPELMRQVGEMWRKAPGVPEPEAIKLVREMWKILVDQVWYIGLVGQSGAQQGIQVTKTKMGNVPRRWLHISRQYSPNIARPMVFYWKG